MTNSNREKDEAQKKQKQIDQVRKILSSAAVNRVKEISPVRDITSTHDTTTTTINSDSTSSNNLREGVTSAVASCNKRSSDDACVEDSLAMKRPRISKVKQSRVTGRKIVKPLLDETNERGSECRSSKSSLEHLLVVAGMEVSL